MVDNSLQTHNRLIDYLPSIYQGDSFLSQFLVAFEKVLIGDVSTSNFEGLEEKIANIATLFDPQQTREDFLNWLASWTAFSLRADLTEKQQRDFIAKIIPLYRRRGTKENLQQLLEIFTVGLPTIEEPEATEFQIGVHSTVGVDTYVAGGGSPHFFQVTVAFPELETAKQLRQLEITKALIELEKPAHTYYKFNPEFLSMQIAFHSTVGVDTLLGTETKNTN